MTLAIGLRTNSMLLAVQLSSPRYRFDPFLMTLVNALLVVVAGLAITWLLAGFLASPLVYYPALTCALFGLWRGLELTCGEVRCYGR